jgi:hypothetical protein
MIEYMKHVNGFMTNTNLSIEHHTDAIELLSAHQVKECR